MEKRVTNKDMFIFSMDLINELINAFDEYSWTSSDAETTRRLERAREYLRKAFVVASPIIYTKENL